MMEAPKVRIRKAINVKMLKSRILTIWQHDKMGKWEHDKIGEMGKWEIG